jgi:hypothetical protein
MLDQQLRLTLAAMVTASIDGVLPADGGFARLGLRREIVAYAAHQRAAGQRPENMLVQLKQLIDEHASRLDAAHQRRVSEDLISWAIEAYYGGTESPADTRSINRRGTAAGNAWSSRDDVGSGQPSGMPDLQSGGRRGS